MEEQQWQDRDTYTQMKDEEDSIAPFPHRSKTSNGGDCEEIQSSQAYDDDDTAKSLK